MRRLGALLVAGAVLLGAAPRASRAQEPPAVPPPPVEPPGLELLEQPNFTLAADEVTYDSERDIYEATGNVRITQPDGRVLTTDWLVFNGTTRTGVATGDVRIVDAQNTVTAEFVAVDLRSTVSVAMRGALDNPQPGFAVRGDVIRRTGVDTYQVHNGVFSTCRCPPDSKTRPWEIEVEDADLELGGYAVGRHLWFKMFDVPVLYVPWLVFPVKTERQTGFLFPSFSQSSRSGTQLELPFFWAASESLNVTLRPQWISRRGWKPTSDFEYVFGESGRGSGGVSVLPGDRQVDGDGDKLFSENRWAYWLRHDHPLLPGVRLGVDLNEVSDNDYVVDFEDFGSDSEHRRMLQSSAWLGAARYGLYGGVVGAVNDDLQNPNDLDRDGFLLQLLPDVRASTLPRGLFGLPLQAGLDARATNFVQLSGRRSVFGIAPLGGQFFDTGADGRFTGQEPAADGRFTLDDNDLDDFANPDAIRRTEGDGLFQEGELLASDGQRIDLYPTLSLPAQLGVFELLAEGGMRETLYFPDLGEDESRTIWTVRGDLRTRFGRSFALRTLPLRHIVEPRVAFAAAFTPDQDENPLFIPAPATIDPRLIDGDIRLLTRDPSDRVSDARLLQVQLSNRLFGPPSLEAGPARFYGELRVGSGYDYVARAFTRVFALAEFRPSRQLQLMLDTGWNPEEHHLQDMTATAGWLSEFGNELRVRYRYNRAPPPIFESFLARGQIFDAPDDESEKVNQIDVSAWLVASSRLELYARGFKSLESSGSDGGSVGVIWISGCKCWELVTEFERQARPDDNRVTVQVRLTGLGDPRRPGDTDRRRRVPADW